jgi:hypothetical protein
MASLAAKCLCKTLRIGCTFLLVPTSKQVIRCSHRFLFFFGPSAIVFM